MRIIVTSVLRRRTPFALHCNLILGLNSLFHHTEKHGLNSTIETMVCSLLVRDSDFGQYSFPDEGSQ